MRRLMCLTAGVVVPFLLAACGESSRPTAPLSGSKEGTGTLGAVSADAGGALVRKVLIHDACDPATFNAAVGPGTCVRPGGMKFDQFVNEVSKHRNAQAWHFAPATFQASIGQMILASNIGGETHTFTRVAAFGGGIVGFLNDLSGNPVPAPECLKLEPDDFVASGGTYSAVVDASGPINFQCCIHPWMRVTVNF